MLFWLIGCVGGELGDDPETAEEVVCDGKDDDGDGAIDEGVTQTRYPDEDGDGWGVTNDAFSYTGCLPEAGWAAQNGDCDDGESAVSPDAAEVCGDDVDDDCDGVADGCNELDPDARAARLRPDGYAMAGHGLAVVDVESGMPGIVGMAESNKAADGVAAWVGLPAGDSFTLDTWIEADEITDLAALDGGITIGSGTGDGRMEVRLGPVAASTGGFARIGDSAVGEVGAVVGGGAWLGAPSVAWAWEGDSWAIGIDALDLTGELLAADAETTVTLAGAPSAFLAVANGGGGDDLLVVGVGSTRFEGPLSGATALADATSTFTTASGGSATAAVADLDGDGTADVAIGDPESDTVAVWLAPADGELVFDAATVRLSGLGRDAGAGLSAVDDLDGDGLPELLVQDSTGPSGVFVVTAPWEGTRSLGDAWRRVADASANYGVGATGGDLDGDGLPELLLGNADPAWVDVFTGAGVVAGP